MAAKGAPENKADNQSPENKLGHNSEPDYEKAAAIIRDEINPLMDDSAGIRGDASAAWKRVKSDCRVNKRAAKEVVHLSKQSADTQSDYFRSLVGLMPHFNLGIRRDLVDMAEGVDGFSIPIIEAPEEDED